MKNTMDRYKEILYRGRILFAAVIMAMGLAACSNKSAEDKKETKTEQSVKKANPKQGQTPKKQTSETTGKKEAASKPAEENAADTEKKS